MKKALLIINPRAGKTKVKAAMFDVVNTLCRHGYLVTATVTQKPGHAVTLTKEMAKDHDIVVCSGGDGTFNEVVSGMISSGLSVPIGYIPSGSTNDFANTLGLSKDLRRAAEDAVTGVRKPMDIGSFNDRYFSYIASFGAFTRASYATPQDTKNVLGHMAYILEGIKDIPSIKAEHVKIETEDKVYEDDYIFGAVANSTSVAGIITLDDKIVMLNDGKFELLLIKKPPNMGELSKCINALLSQNYNSDMIEFASMESGVITTDENLVWSLDGERADTDGHVEIKNLHNAVTLILPSASADSSIF